MSVYNLKLTTLTPLHIGDGDELRQGFDFMFRSGRTYRLNEDAVLIAKSARLLPDKGGHYPLPGSLLDEADFQDASFFRYVLPGFPRSAKADARLKSFIKDVHDRAYIPGSSLKGALRTALAWTGWDEVKPQLDRAAIGRSRSWAGQPLEHKIFGPDPNHDLLRALQVSDMNRPAQPGEGLMVINAQVLTPKGHGTPIELEALRGDLVFTGSLTIDETLFTPAAERELRFGSRKRWLERDELLARVKTHSLARIKELAVWFEHAEGCEKIARFYRRLEQFTLASNSAMLQLGWGTGWDGMTFWTHLQSDTRLFEQLVDEFKLHKASASSPPRRTGDPFPRSKRAGMVVKDGVANPAAPFGWVLVELEKPA